MSEEQGSQLEVAAQETEVIEGDKPEVVETKTEETQAPEVEAKTEEEAEEGLPDEAKEKTRRRFKKLLKDMDSLRQRAEAAEARLAQEKPTLEQFDHDIEKYTEAAGKHIAETVVAENDLKEATQAADDYRGQILSAWEEIKQEAIKQYPDLDQVFKGTPVSQTMAETIVQMDNAGDVAYYLGQHKKEAAEIASLPVAMQGFEMARLSMRVKPKPKDTTAPTPPTTPARGAGNAGKKSWEEMSDAEFSALRAKERAAWRKEHM